MKYKFIKIIFFIVVVVGFIMVCIFVGENIFIGKRYEFNNILDIVYIFDILICCGGWFIDVGFWMGFIFL